MHIKGQLASFRTAATMFCPNVIGGTNCPSIIDVHQSVPAASTAATCSPGG
jgi:hypothetical protein